MAAVNGILVKKEFCGRECPYLISSQLVAAMMSTIHHSVILAENPPHVYVHTYAI